MLVWAEPLNDNRANRVALAQADPAAIRRRLLSHSHHGLLKRIFDIVVVLLALPAVLPVILVFGLLVVITSGRPVFFLQDRVGLNGRVFKLIKLRTMRTQTSGPTRATASGDPRITPIGHFLRRSHIDELPQLWNILRGEMTLVGPRPEQPPLVETYRREIPHYDLRHLVPPGLSGLSQVCFGYACTLQETREKLEYDLFYLQNFGLFMDVLILARTVRVYMSPQYVR